MKKIAVVIDSNVRNNHDVIIGLCDELNKHNTWDFQILSHQLPFSSIRAAFEKFMPDAIVVRNLQPELSAYLESLQVPFVVVADEGPSAKNASVVTQDSHLIGEMAASYLRDQKFLYFGHVVSKSIKQSIRSKAYIEKIQKSKKPVYTFELENNSLIDHPFYQYQNASALISWLKKLPKPCGIFCHSDQLALYVARTCHFHKISIPYEISLLGVDNDTLFCQLTKPHLASIYVSYRRIGIEAAKILNKWKPGRLLARIPPSTVVERGSCLPPLRSEPLINNALDYIRRHSANGLRVSDLLKLTGLSPNQLTYRFQLATGRSPKEMILNQRIQDAKLLLADTSDSVVEVGHQCGFNSASQFFAIFKDRMGITPSRYRQQFSK